MKVDDAREQDILLVGLQKEIGNVFEDLRIGLVGVVEAWRVNEEDAPSVSVDVAIHLYLAGAWTAMSFFRSRVL
jgi:hypothetical protein